MGSSFAGSEDTALPLNVTLYVSGSISISPNVSLRTSCCLPMVLVLPTGRNFLSIPYFSSIPSSKASFDVNITEVLDRAKPKLPNIGLKKTG